MLRLHNRPYSCFGDILLLLETWQPPCEVFSDGARGVVLVSPTSALLYALLMHKYRFCGMHIAQILFYSLPGANL